MSFVPYSSEPMRWREVGGDADYGVTQSGRGVEDTNIRLVNTQQAIVERAKSQLRKRINSSAKTKRLQSKPKTGRRRKPVKKRGGVKKKKTTKLRRTRTKTRRKTKPSKQQQKNKKKKRKN